MIFLSGYSLLAHPSRVSYDTAECGELSAGRTSPGSGKRAGVGQRAARWGRSVRSGEAREVGWGRNEAARVEALGLLVWRLHIKLSSYDYGF